MKNSSYSMKIELLPMTTFDFRYEQVIKSNKHHILFFHSFNGIARFKLLKYLFHLKSLPRLFSLSIRLNECYDDLGDIYRILFRFPILKYLKFETFNKQKMSITIPVASDEHFSSIEHLLIHFTCTLNELTDLLSYTSRITHLSCPNIVRSGEILKTELKC